MSTAVARLGSSGVHAAEQAPLALRVFKLKIGDLGAAEVLSQSEAINWSK
tara:strand:+ start:741 stop:890 length:150 start_codon:yes stop_codon:yes gene_type:complete